MKIIRIDINSRTKGETWHDVHIMPNGIDPVTKKAKVIFSCQTDKDAKAFFEGLKKLIKKHTIEEIE